MTEQASRPTVLILTPAKDAASSLSSYVRGLEHLSYSRESISLGMLESDSVDGTFSHLQALRPQLEQRFTRVCLFKRDFGFRLPPGVPRWTPTFQQVRRGILARSRNHLLMRALDDEDWVLWLDVDVVDYPADLVEMLLSVQRDIVHPHCVLDPGGGTFDRNAWRDKGRSLMSDLRGAGGPVRIDSVGGTVLLVRADCHRDGLIFPPFPYGQPNPHIRDTHPVWGIGEMETEGLGMMAYDMGLQCWGLPDYEVFHQK